MNFILNSIVVYLNTKRDSFNWWPINTFKYNSKVFSNLNSHCQCFTWWRKAAHCFSDGQAIEQSRAISLFEPAFNGTARRIITRQPFNQIEISFIV